MESFREPMVPADISDRLDRLEKYVLFIIEMLSQGGDDEDPDVEPIDSITTLDDAPLQTVPLPLVMDDEL